jgi:hypothetical protein
MQEAWPRLARSGILAFAMVNVELRSLRARAAIAAATMDAASSRPDPDWSPRRLLRLAAREAHRTERLRYLPPARPLAALVRAGVARCEGRADEALAALDDAARGFAAADMALHHAAARRAEGVLRGGSAGEALRRESEVWMAGQGMRVATAMARAVAPGFEPA